MRAVVHPAIESVTLPMLLHALADPVRLAIVCRLAAEQALTCGAFEVAVSMSTLSHHLKVLRLAGLLRVVQEGSYRRNELRFTEVERQFPGVLGAVLSAAGPAYDSVLGESEAPAGSAFRAAEAPGSPVPRTAEASEGTALRAVGPPDRTATIDYHRIG
ncbi:MAG TPA: helix-turn-helix domain-containing protein [Pseudonocardiaceae bacterium]|jgi:DNA-binding transcriptional ArsR family regulator|nr:helix-turn-helix domain-containing protein [Pseudonocardiaceae bacterium]